MRVILPAQEVTVQTWQPWVDQETDEPIRDNYGNHKGSVIFDEYPAQPVDATFKEPPAVGAKKYGSIEEYNTKAGKTRVKYVSAQRPKEGFTPSAGGKTYQPRDDMAIRAQWAIGQAVSVYNASASKDPNMDMTGYIESLAKKFYAMVDRVKGSSPAVTKEENWTPSSEEMAALDAQAPMPDNFLKYDD
jgi:hypothetical protein